MATTVTRDEVLDGMVTALASLKPAKGSPITPTAYVRDISRYAGEFSSQEAMQRGMAGRTPAILIAYERERVLSTTVGRKVDKVEGSFFAICCNDAERSRDDRASIFKLMGDATQLLGARYLGLSIQALRYTGDSLVADDGKVLAYALRFTTRYRRDYTKQATYPPLLSADGSLNDATSGETVVGVNTQLPGPEAP